MFWRVRNSPSKKNKQEDIRRLQYIFSLNLNTKLYSIFHVTFISQNLKLPFLLGFLRCQCGLEAKRTEEGPFAVEVCSKAIGYGEVTELKVGPWPTEVESALLLTQAAYTKAQCLSWEIEDQGLLRLSWKDEIWWNEKPKQKNKMNLSQDSVEYGVFGCGASCAWSGMELTKRLKRRKKRPKCTDEVALALNSSLLRTNQKSLRQTWLFIPNYCNPNYRNCMKLHQYWWKLVNFCVSPKVSLRDGRKRPPKSWFHRRSSRTSRPRSSMFQKDESRSKENRINCFLKVCFSP